MKFLRSLLSSATISLWETGVNYRNDIDPKAPYEVEVRYKGQRYIVRRGRIVELMYGFDKLYGTNGQRAEPTNLSRSDYEAILQLAKDKAERDGIY